MGAGAMRLGRAPREVYRVYSESEFFADGADEKRREAEHGVAGARKLQRLAGVTVLLATVGAVGGLIALASLPVLTGGRRRAGSRASADLASPARTSLPLRRQTPLLHRLTAPSRSARAHKPAGGTAQAGGQRTLHGTAGGRRHPPAKIVGPTNEQTPVGAELVASATASPRGAVVLTPSGQIEFGFER
jgi:hypothetical protein